LTGPVLSGQNPVARLIGRLYDMPWLMMVLPPLFWAGNSIVGKALAGTAPPISLAFWRWVLSALLILPFAWPHLRRDWAAIRAHWKLLLTAALLGVSCFNTMLYMGLTGTTALNAVMLQTTMPALVTILAALFLKEPAGPMQVAGLVLSFCGSAALVSQGDPARLINLHLNPGDLWVLGAVAAYALYTILVRRRPSVHPLSFVAVTFVLGAAGLVPFFLWESAAVGPLPITPATLAALAYIATLPSIIAYLCFNRAVQLLGPTVAGFSIYLILVFGAIFAVALLGEEWRFYHGVGVALILGGVVLAGRRPG
jgi:drug/metabolite transporter (DMT)-like permease